MEDKKKVDGLRLAAWNPNVELEFYDESVRIAYKSENAAYIRSRIREKITRSSVAIGLLGHNTHRSEWVDWELKTAREMGKKIVLMGLPNGPGRLILPESVRDLSWYLWDIDVHRREVGA